MNKELCFILDNKNIYLDHILVDYEYVPIFFLCKDDECQYYLALCTDIENGEYIVVKISLLSVYNLLHGNIAMRDVILNQKIFWKVVSGDEIKNDIVNEYPIDYINHQDLPEKDAKFKILQKHIKEYVQKFDKEFFASEQYDKEKSIKLNLEDMQEALKYIEGEHDFSSFRSAGGNDTSPIREIYEASCTKENNVYTFKFWGSGFLYHMVRNIMGLMINIGLGRVDKHEVPKIIEAKNRALAGKMAPANGLYLQKVYY